MTHTSKTPKDVLDFAKKQEAKQLDLRFTDLPGLQQHLSYPLSELTESSFEEGFGIDGSSIRGWAAINESDMLLIPDISRFWIDQFMDRPTLCIATDVVDPITRESYWLDPRALAKRAENYLKFTGVADTVFFGPEAEFFIFDQVSFHNENHSSGATVDSSEGWWNTASDSNKLGWAIRGKEGYVPCPPLDSIHNIRSEIAAKLKDVGLTVECHHHEVATAGQCEIDFRYFGLHQFCESEIQKFDAAFFCDE